MYIHTIYCY